MPLIALFIDWALTATWPIVGRRALLHFDPLTFAELALLLGFLTLLPFLGRRLVRLFEPGLRVPLFWMGVFGSGIPSLLLVTAVGHTTPANAAIVCQVEVVYSAVLASLLLGERIGPKQVAGTTLVLVGTGLILAKDIGTPHWKGDLILLLTPWMFQVSHILSKRLPRDVDYVTIAGARMFYGCLVLAPFAVGSWLLGVISARFSAEAWALLAYQSTLLGSVNLVLWYVAIRNLELAKTTAVMLSYPALTLVFSWVLGSEPIGWHQVAGLGLSMGGAVWLTFQMRDGLPAGEPAPA